MSGSPRGVRPGHHNPAAVECQPGERRDLPHGRCDRHVPRDQVIEQLRRNRRFRERWLVATETKHG